MTYNVFGGTLNLTDSFNLEQNRSSPTYWLYENS